MKWLKVISRANWTPNDTSNYSRVCSLHCFPTNYKQCAMLKRLLPTAVPSQFPSYSKYMQPPMKTMRRLLSRTVPVPPNVVAPIQSSSSTDNNEVYIEMPDICKTICKDQVVQVDMLEQTNRREINMYKIKIKRNLNKLQLLQDNLDKSKEKFSELEHNPYIKSLMNMLHDADDNNPAEVLLKREKTKQAMKDKAVTVKFLKWETMKVLPQNEESVKALNEKLQDYKGNKLSKNQQKLMYSGKILIEDDKPSFGLSFRPAVVLMVTNTSKRAEDGSLIYIEGPPENRRLLALKKLSEKAKLSSKIKSGDEPPKAESEKDKDFPKAESDSEKKLPKAEKENKSPIVKPNFGGLSPKEKLKIQTILRKFDLLLENPKTKSDIEKLLPNKKSEKRPLKGGSETEKPSPKGESETKKPSPKGESETKKPSPKGESETKKPSPKGESETKKPPLKADTHISDIDQPKSADKSTGQDAFKFIGEFMDIGDGPELYVLKNSQNLISLSEDKLIKIMKQKLEPVSKLIMNIKYISPLRSKL